MRWTAKPVDATWAVFFIPAAILLVWALLDWWLIKDTPEDADFPHFDPHDASSGQMHIELTTMDLLKKVFASPLMLMIAVIGLTSGVMRNGIMTWYFIFAKEVKQTGAEFFLEHWGLLLCFFGIVGGFAGGLVSDKFFQSRRGPPTAILCGFMFLMALLMAIYLFSSPLVVGLGRPADHHGGDWRPLADVGHGGRRFWRPQSHRHLFGHCGRLRLFGNRNAVRQPRLPDRP